MVRYPFLIEIGRSVIKYALHLLKKDDGEVVVPAQNGYKLAIAGDFNNLPQNEPILAEVEADKNEMVWRAKLTGRKGSSALAVIEIFPLGFPDRYLKPDTYQLIGVIGRELTEKVEKLTPEQMEHPHVIFLFPMVTMEQLEKAISEGEDHENSKN